MRKKTLYIQDDVTNDVNISPLIDMMFLLLIFFIVTTSFIDESGFDIEKPVSKNAHILNENSIHIGIDRNGNIIFNDKIISQDQFQIILSEKIKENINSIVIIADKHSYTKYIINIYDVCEKAGIKNISIATEQNENL